MISQLADRRHWVWIGAAVALGGAGLWWAASPGSGAEAAGATPAAVAASGSAVAATALAPLSAASAAMLASVNPPAAPASAVARAQVISVEALRKAGSLRGTEMDGDWGQFSGGVLTPSIRLRQRFDHLLIGIGEVDPDALRSWIADQVRTAHGDKGAAQVLSVYDAYIKLQRSQVGSKAADPSDPSAWQRWIAERAAARSEALGPAWAQAFFAEEERDLREFGERMVQRASAPPGALEPEQAAQKALLPTVTVLDPKAVALRQEQRVQYFGAEGAQRLAAEDKAWAVWTQRIEAARQRRDHIASDKQLSELQRQQALEADLARHFQGTDLIRAKGLVQP